ncbi:COG2426 family protein [Dysosmobacter sp.]|uniref:COG2426 family protein n=1 Tax=Dysosmobacter sp. TaxID=2591382 RepID=UPI002A8F589A|nr:small multi-drug export protein [Dysosmobacter sp.]MDY3280983.1 small multi-drug export protein [Dysosmobacter sp.]
MLETLFGKCMMVFAMAMVPVVELRGAIPLGVSMGLPPLTVYILAVLGNVLPVPFIILLVRRVFDWLRRGRFWGPKIAAMERRAHLKGRLVRKYRLLGLIVLVAVPLPGTGAWTGALVAALFDIRLRSALPAILLGVAIAGGIMLAVSCGLLALWF